MQKVDLPRTSERVRGLTLPANDTMYVFDYDEAEVAGHIPEPARRALGPMDEARVRHLRALLLKRLDR